MHSQRRDPMLCLDNSHMSHFKTMLHSGEMLLRPRNTLDILHVIADVGGSFPYHGRHNHSSDNDSGGL